MPEQQAELSFEIDIAELGMTENVEEFVFA